MQSNSKSIFFVVVCLLAGILSNEGMVFYKSIAEQTDIEFSRNEKNACLVLEESENFGLDFIDRSDKKKGSVIIGHSNGPNVAYLYNIEVCDLSLRTRTSIEQVGIYNRPMLSQRCFLSLQLLI